MSKSTINDFELGNLVMGNSRETYNFPSRSIVDSNSWQELMDLLKAEDYHATFSNSEALPFDYTGDGGIKIVKDNQVVFEIHPYYWGDCTCGAEEVNEKLDELRRKEIFTDDEWELYMTFEDWCDNDCPASILNINTEEKTEEELLKLCTCGTVQKNIELRKKKEKIKNKIHKYEDREKNEFVPHDESCLLVRHNFIWHPKQENEFWIDWYKYPFRDSHMNQEKTEEEILAIFDKCYEIAKEIIESKSFLGDSCYGKKKV